ncbi:MAG: aspartate--tRNA ligase [Candidatus Vogelbacteria bacterium]|nr:aspartate--tRNA ligase [Candidatus Vogelbacteria bacterium]
MRHRTLTKNLKSQVGEEVALAGWVDVRRDHGQLIFLDLRDGSGKIQLVVGPGPVHETADKLRPEWVIEIIGQVKKRPEKMTNSGSANGELEIEVREIKILNQAETPPFDLQADGRAIAEETRLQYRYLDLRRPRLQQNLQFRHRLIKFIRDYLSEVGFIEVETPILSKTTPEGARDYLVPSRLQPGQFYALPQSPQQYKQLLMVAGVEKYFQIARCFRDEDTRGDRQPEFTQLDLEMAFVEQAEVMMLNEELLLALIQELSPTKKILQIPFPRLTYREAVDKYGNDRPDLRPDKNNSQSLAFCWITDFPFFEKTETGAWTFTHNPFSAPKPEFMDQLLKGERISEIIASQYDIVLNGSEIGGGSIRNHRPEALRAVFKILGHDETAIEANFGHLLKGLASGAPPHGGIAWGLDRLISILADEPNIREVIAFPKTGEGRDLLMGAPAAATPEQLKELKLKIDPR